MLKHSEVSTSGGRIHVVETGLEHDSTVLFLHGWPQDWSAWTEVMNLAGEHVHALAIDLPGVGKSVMANAPGAAHEIAEMLSGVVAAMRRKSLSVVGHDIGGQVAYACLVRHSEQLDAAVIMDVVVPGLPPWEDVLRNPKIWHFAFHAVPGLPELLVSGKEREYFDFFYEAIARHPERITPQARDGYAAAYATPAALSTGFNWYRAFPQVAGHNLAVAKQGARIETPLLYLRGSHESGRVEEYLEGFRGAGVRSLRSVVIDDCGHFAPEEQPVGVWNAILDFLRDVGVVPHAGRA
jgi:pimeloyl-ACP methyl ester carboxylesterase